MESLPREWSVDFRAFGETIDGCFSDKRIASYFEQGVVTRKQMSQVLNEREVFDEAVQLNSYQNYNDLREQERRSSNLSTRLVSRTDLSMARQSWLTDSIEEVIIPNIILAINTILGHYQNTLVIERDSEGLRRLQDPTFRVPTRTRKKLISLLSQMDGGSVAVAGPRGAGKSTLLKQFSQPLDSDIKSVRTVTVYVPAPSNYVARDFIAELFQRLCESYLFYCDYPLTEEFYNIGRSRIGRRRATHEILRIFWLAIRVVIAIILVILVIWPLATHKGFATGSNFTFGHHLADGTVKFVRGWWDNYQAYFAAITLLVALETWPPKRVWRTYLRRSQEPELIKRACEYLLRLQIDKTVTRGAGVSAPNVRGIGFSMNKSSSVKYTPWSLPELVSYVRRFMQDISSNMKGANRPVVVAIDEIDRIGSLEDAEGFIGEIKAVFGVEGCYFLVAVAEDVGSLFAQRATAGRSILENAFDEIVGVGPLTLEEARSLLLKRVPGFTDAFVYLVHAMSGGLPRELIRVTRRLVEMNFEQLDNLENPRLEDYPRLEDLSRDLVAETMIEVLDAARNQMSQLLLQSDWASLLDYVRTAGITLRHDRSLPSKLYETITEIAEFQLPDRIKNESSKHVETEADDYAAAARILNNLSASAYFGVTVIDAFSDKYFDLAETKRRTDARTDNAYEELAAARIELSVSYASARLILDRFRASLQSILTKYLTTVNLKRGLIGMVRLVPERPTGSPIIARFLPGLLGPEVNNEYLITVRQHPAVLLAPTTFFVGWSAVASIPPAAGLLRDWLSPEFIWAAWVLLLIRFAWKVLEWFTRYVAIATSYKIVVYSGLRRRKVVTAGSLTKVVRLTVYRSVPGRFFDYGELQFESVSQVQPFWSLYYVPYPQQLFLEIYGLISAGDLYPGEMSGRKITAEI